jgi:hypothetical protein
MYNAPPCLRQPTIQCRQPVATARSEPVPPALVAAEEAVLRFAPIEGPAIPLVQVDYSAEIACLIVASTTNPVDLHFRGSAKPVSCTAFYPFCNLFESPNSRCSM